MQTTIHLAYSPKFCITVVFFSSWVDCATQEELERGIGEGGGAGGANKGCLPFTKRIRKIWLESKSSTTFWVVPEENFREQRNLCFSGRNS